MKEIGITLIIALILLLPTYLYNYTNKKTYTCKVTDKWIKRQGDRDIYIVRCDDKTYKITDLFFKFKFNSSDLYGQLKVGHTYKIKTTGYRVKLFSDYQNINSIKEVHAKDNN